MTSITHQTTNMTQPPILRTYQMNTRVVGSKTMVMIVTPRGFGLEGFCWTGKGWTLANLWGIGCNRGGPWRGCRRTGAIALLRAPAEELIACESQMWGCLMVWYWGTLAAELCASGLDGIRTCFSTCTLICQHNKNTMLRKAYFFLS